MDELRTNVLPRDAIGEFIKSPRGIRSYEELQGDTTNLYQAISTASFLTVSSEPTLGAERILEPSSDLIAADGGAGGSYTLGLSDTTVVPGTYGGVPKLLTVSVDAKGRLTDVSEASFDTDDVPEGATNLYYTNARARLAVSAVAPLSYDSTTGAISVTGSALTRTNDTNVTVTLGGTPASALLAPASITLGWTGTLAVARGGSGAGTLTGYLKGNGTSPFTASATIPNADVAGLGAAALQTYVESTWTPVVTALAGTLTSYTASGVYTRVGRIIEATATINITTNGTAASGLSVTLPLLSASGANWVGVGRDQGISGKMLQAQLNGPGGSFILLNYDNTYPAANGSVLVVTIRYHV